MPTSSAIPQCPVLRPGDDGYDAARSVFNAMIDRRPDRIVRCATPADVAAGVVLARTERLPLAIKSGGHSVAGTAVCDGGMVLDLSSLKGVSIDMAQRTVTVQAGVTLGEVDAATAVHGMATPTGIVSVTGLSGLALGGGLGWLNGAYGLSCDNFVSLQVVTADGELVTASEGEHPDLFWALRGGGGNFGVVTSFTLRLHPVSTVLTGMMSFAADRAPDALAAYHEVASNCPDEISINASVYKGAEGRAGVAVAYCHLDASANLGALLGGLRGIGPQDATAGPAPFVGVQRASDAGFPEGQQHYWKSGSLTNLADDAIATLLDHVERMPSPASGIGLQQLHGAAARVEPTATAYPHRSVRYDFLVLSQWSTPAESPDNIAWTRKLFDAMGPFLDVGVYVNNLGDEGAFRVRQAYGPNYDRLVAVKSVYDPTNLFRHNHNIPPAPPGPHLNPTRPPERTSGCSSSSWVTCRSWW